MATLTEVTPSQVLAAYNIMPLRAKYKLINGFYNTNKYISS
jgi:hypothetical protein